MGSKAWNTRIGRMRWNQPDYEKNKEKEDEKMKQRFFLTCLALIGIVLAMSLFWVPPGAEARDIKVGIIDCYSGPPAVYGKDALNGFKLALKDINEKGVLGKT